MADGIIQFIRLALDKASLTDVEKETTTTSQKVASSLASVITGVLNSTADAATKASAIQKAAVDATLVHIQKEATGYAGWQMAVRKALSSVGQAYDALRGKITLVDVPDPEKIDGIERARLRKKYKGNNAEFNVQLQKIQLLSQLSGTQLTWAGKAATFFGLNVAKVAPQVQTLIGRLQQLGASGTVINRNMPFWANGMNRFGNSLISVGRAFGFYYSARQAVDFLKDSVQIAGKSQVAWAQLSTTVSDYGSRLSDLMPQIQPLFDQQAKLGVSYSDSAKNLARLVQITGDVQGSMRALRVVQDMAASGFMTLEQASKQVGRAMLGDIGSISRYGIFLDKNRDVLDQLGKRFGGEQLMRAKTLTGQLERMGVAWYEVKVAIGGAIAEGARADGFFEKMIGYIQSLRDWVIQNQVAIKMLGVAIMSVMAAFGVIIFGLVNGFVTILNTIGTVSVGLTALAKSFPDLFMRGMETVAVGMTKMLRDLAAGWDDLLGTHMAAKFDAALARMEHDVAVRKRRIDKNMEEGNELIRGIWAGQEDPRAIDAKGSGVVHIRAREHQRRRSELGEVRANVLSANLDMRERGLKRLAAIEEEINARMEEDKDNEASMIQLGKDKAIVEKIRADLEKKNNQTSKEEAAYRRRIEQLSAVAREADDKQALEAVRLLNVEHDKLLEKRRHMAIGSDEWVKNEALVKQVEDGINGHLEKQDKLFSDRVKKLGDMVDLDVNRQDAVEQINNMMDEQNRALAEAAARQAASTKGSAAYNQALEDQIRAKQKLVLLETALRNETTLTDERIDELEKELHIADKRVAAERKLVSLREVLNKQAREGKTDAIRKTAAGQAARITGMLDTDPVDVNKITKQLQAAREMIKHMSTRKKAVEELARIQEHINDLMTRDNVTAGEKIQLERQQLLLLKLQHDALEPNLDMMDELRYVFENDLPKMAEDTANAMADVFDTAFTYILRDARNINHALSSIPKGMARAMLAEIAAMAKGKAAENIAWAIEATAHGFRSLANPLTVSLAPAFFKSAAEHTLAAAKWGLLGGAAGALGQSASSAYSNATDFASGDRGGAADGQGRNAPDIYLTIDGVDPSNPRHQRLVGETSREYQERYGGRIILTTGR